MMNQTSEMLVKSCAH